MTTIGIKLSESETLPPANDCFVCILSPIICFGQKLGLAQLEGRCIHIQGTPCSPEFRVIKKGFLAPLLLTIGLILCISYEFYMIKQLTDKMEALRLASDLLVSSISLVIILSLPRHIRINLTSLNAWIKLRTTCSSYGFKSMITPRRLCHLKTGYKIFLVLFVKFVLILLLDCLWLIKNKTFNGRTIAEIVALVCFFVQIYVVAQVNTFALFLSGIFENFEAHMKEILKNRKTDLKNSVVLGRKFYSAILCNIRYMNKSYGLILIMWILQLLLILIVNIFILVKYDRTRFTFQSIVLDLRTQFLILNVVVMLHFVQTTGNKVRVFFDGKKNYNFRTRDVTLNKLRDR